MELDQFKESWRALDDAPPLPADLPTLLERAERAAARPLRRMKRNLIKEAIFLVVVYALAYTAFQGPIRVPVGIFYIIAILTAAIYYTMQYKTIRSMESISSEEDVVSYFSKRVRRLRGFLRFNMRLTYVLVVVVMWFVCWVTWKYDRPHFYRFAGIRLHPGQEVLIVIGWTLVGVIMMVPAHFAARWVNYRLYGRYIDMLEENLKELTYF